MSFKVEHTVDNQSLDIEISIEDGDKFSSFIYEKDSMEGKMIQALIDGDYYTSYVGDSSDD